MRPLTCWMDFMVAPFGSTTVESMARLLGRPMMEEEDADVDGATWTTSR